jgi:hypothetical protein
MKKIIIFFIFGLFLLAGKTNASITFNPIPPQNVNINIQTNCSGGDIMSIYQIESIYDGSPVGISCGDNINWSNYGISIPQTLIFIECDTLTSSGACDFSGLDLNTALTNARNDTGFISETTFRLGTPIGISILGGTAPSVGTPFDGAELRNQLTARVGMTMDGVAPLLAVIVGIFLCMIIISKITGLFDEVKEEEHKHEVIPDISQVKEKFYNWNK